MTTKMGRGSARKIPMQKRDSPEKLNVTFTKRRMGLFHKASELSRLCDAQVAVLVSSPNRKYYYSFAPTSAEAVLDSFLAGHVPAPVSEGVTREAHRLAEEVEGLEGKLRHAKELRKGVGAGGCPWEALRKYEESATSPEELRALYDSLSKLKAKYDRRNEPTTCSGAGSNVVVADSPSQLDTSANCSSAQGNGNHRVATKLAYGYDMAGNCYFLPVNDRGTCTTAAIPLTIVRSQEEERRVTVDVKHRQERESYGRRSLPEFGRIGCEAGSRPISWDKVGMGCDTTTGRTSVLSSNQCLSDFPFQLGVPAPWELTRLKIG